METRDCQLRQPRPAAGGSSFACNSPNCTGVLLGAVASVLVIGGIFLAFHNWDYNWLLVTAVGSILVLVAAAMPFCSADRTRGGVSGKRGPHGIGMLGNDTLPSAPPLSASYSVSQLSLNILPPPPVYPGCEDIGQTPQNSPPNGAPVNHIMNINGQSYLLLPIVSPTGQTSSNTVSDVPNQRYSAALSCLQVELPNKQEHQRQEITPNQSCDSNRALEAAPPTPQVTRDLLCESSISHDMTSTLPATNAPNPNAQDLTAPLPDSDLGIVQHADDGNVDRDSQPERCDRVQSPGISESDVIISDRLPLITIDHDSLETRQEDDECETTPSASRAGNDTDFLLAVGGDISDGDDDILVGATPPPSYDEVANEAVSSAPAHGASSFGTL